jgi:4-hydroxythreonine-4-phosphate dehydrogenase
MKEAHAVAGSQALVRTTTTPDDVVSETGITNVLDIGTLNYQNVPRRQVSNVAGKASVEWVLKAGELAKAGKVQAIITAPINKEACSLAGYKDIGHMEIFQRQSGADNVATMLMTENLRVVHMTTHQSLRNACEYVTKETVLSKIVLTHNSFIKWGYPSPSIGVAALNPHASDGGLLGDEEAEHIRPAIKEALSLKINASGPIPADTVFNQAIDGKFNVVLAMYHDQGHIPIKVHNWAKSISVNLGLPYVRTSVDHGTAFDIAGRGIADHESMLEAIRVAVDLIDKSVLKNI